MIKLIIPGEPVAKARPRVTKYGTYTPQKTKDYEELVKWTCRNQYKDKPLEGPLRVDISFYMYIPKNTSKRRRTLKESKIILPVKRPDIDNLAKSITDALNGLVYKDDNQIVELHLYKYYSKEERAEVTITEIKGG